MHDDDHTDDISQPDDNHNESPPIDDEETPQSEDTAASEGDDEEQSPHNVTELLHEAIQHQDRDAQNELYSLLFSELRKIARAKLRQGSSRKEATELVNDCYLRILGNSEKTFENRKHFYRYATRVMINILIDEHRRTRKERDKHASGDDDMINNQMGELGNLLSQLSLDEDKRRVDDALDQLEDVEREIVIMRTFLEMGWREIVEIQELPLGTCHGKYTRAIEKLKTLVNGDF